MFGGRCEVFSSAPLSRVAAIEASSQASSPGVPTVRSREDCCCTKPRP